VPIVQAFDAQTDSASYKPWTINEHGKSQNGAEEGLAEKFNDFMKKESSGLCESEAECEQLRARFWKTIAATMLIKEKKGDDQKNPVFGSLDNLSKVSSHSENLF
jgi:hypothetical protein